MILPIVIVFIVHGSLFPWHFDFARLGPNPFLVLLHSWPVQWDYYAIQDAALNVALYLPLGAGAFLSAEKKRAPAAAGVAALCLGLGLSTGLELLQVYVPGRVGSVCDIVFNLGGAFAGIVLAIRFKRRLETEITAISRLWSPRFYSAPALLLALWAGYQLYPLVPQFRVGSLQAQAIFLLHPRQFDPNSPYWAEILIATAEWLTAVLAAQSLFGPIRSSWFAAALGLRFALRPFLFTRLFALDELLGAALAFALWNALPERILHRAALAMLLAAILLRDFTAVPFSRLPYNFVPAGGVLLRKAFDYGAVLWILRIRPRDASTRLTWLHGER
jgi:glycopeptide antibiotics resistance protein